ncbi:MAG: helix-turn-helix transcriptional regulator [Eubacteriales bacterium]|nr:helix-turn-helix transcriptional regulator [Eubacteriales bacterium]
MLELNIGSVIARTRRGKDMTQEALAETVGVSAAAVSKWETGGSLR